VQETPPSFVERRRRDEFRRAPEAWHRGPTGLSFLEKKIPEVKSGSPESPLPTVKESRLQEAAVGL